jgi:hypothetical protein
MSSDVSSNIFSIIYIFISIVLGYVLISTVFYQYKETNHKKLFNFGILKLMKLLQKVDFCNFISKNPKLFSTYPHKNIIIVVASLIFNFTLFTSSVYSYEVVESLDSVEDTNLKIIKLLNNLTEDKVEPLEKTRGFSYRYSTRTDRYCRSDFTYPVALKRIASKIDEHIDSEGVVVDPAGYVVRDTRTKVGA